jgi:hypothetical protein
MNMSVSFEVLTAASMKMTVFWVAPCSLVEVHRRETAKDTFEKIVYRTPVGDPLPFLLHARSKYRSHRSDSPGGVKSKIGHTEWNMRLAENAYKQYIVFVWSIMCVCVYACEHDHQSIDQSINESSYIVITCSVFMPGNSCAGSRWLRKCKKTVVRIPVGSSQNPNSALAKTANNYLNYRQIWLSMFQYEVANYAW